jgi:hypothetical protein
VTQKSGWSECSAPLLALSNAAGYQNGTQSEHQGTRRFGNRLNGISMTTRRVVGVEGDATMVRAAAYVDGAVSREPSGVAPY